MSTQDAPLTAEILLNAYANGYFPMAESRTAKEIYWFAPEQRGILPLDRFHVPRSLKKHIKQHPYRITIDTAFPQVIQACAHVKRSHEKGSWINAEIIRLYTELWQLGWAHSVECWIEGELVGGLYGVSIGGAFFGESMFSTATNASKIALVTLVDVLKSAGYTLLDTQYVNAHLTQFGIEEVSKADYEIMLEKALYVEPNPSSRFSTVSGSILNASSLPEMKG